MTTIFEVRAFFDREAQVWCAQGVNFAGLAADAKTIDLLLVKVKNMLRDLMEEWQDEEQEQISLHLNIQCKL